MLWELLFMMLVLKIPVVYLCAVVWYAIKAEPEPAGGESTTASDGDQPSPWQPWRAWRRAHGPRPRRGSPHGAPARAAARARRPAGATATIETRRP